MAQQTFLAHQIKPGQRMEKRPTDLKILFVTIQVVLLKTKESRQNH
jgi:hypothetical protein